MHGEQTHDLPSWADGGRRFHESIQLTPFKFILIIIAICVMVVGIAYSLRYRLFLSRIWMTFFIVVMLLVYMGHLAISLYVGSGMPGVYSAVLRDYLSIAWYCIKF